MTINNASDIVDHWLSPKLVSSQPLQHRAVPMQTPIMTSIHTREKFHWFQIWQIDGVTAKSLSLIRWLFGKTPTQYF